MLVITGDVHHMSMKGSDQKFMSGTEPKLTAEYVDIISHYGVAVTLFVTGKALEEEPEVFRKIAENPLVEFGGHNYYAFKPRWLYGKVFGKIMGTNSGPRFYQDWEIKKTKRAFKEVLGVDIVSWRNHGYRHDNHTYALLKKNGIRIVSDDVGPARNGPYRHSSGLISLPVNTLPDHDHLIHGNEKERPAGTLIRNRFDYGTLKPQEWLDTVLQQTEALMEEKGTATLLLHPGCMAILDNFRTFEKLIGQLSGRYADFKKVKAFVDFDR